MFEKEKRSKHKNCYILRFPLSGFFVLKKVKEYRRPQLKIHFEKT